MAYPVVPISFAENTLPFPVSNSLRFDGSSYLAKRILEGNTRTFTQSFWFKRGTLSTNQWIGPTVGTQAFIAGVYIGSGNGLNIYIHYNFRTASWEGWLQPTARITDPHAWYHLVVAVDTTQTSPENRIKVYLNGQRIVTFNQSFFPQLNQETVFNTTVSTTVSAINNTNATPNYYYIGYGHSSEYFSGYLSEMYWVDGLALTPTLFGRYDQNGNWVPRKYSGNLGVNGFYLPFNNTSATSYLGLNMGSPAGADPFWSNTLYHMQTRNTATVLNNNTFLDSSPTNATVTRTGAVAQGTFNPFNNTFPPLCSCSAYFDGGSAELNAGSNANFAFGTDSYTVEFWVYQTSEAYSAGTGPCFVFNDASGGWGIWNRIGGASPGLNIVTRTTGINILSSGSLLPINRWNHIAVCRESSTIAMWLNGQRIALGGDTTNWTQNGPLKIGGLTTAGYYVRGWMSDVNIMKGVSKYSTSSTTIPLPTQPIEPTTNTVFLANFRNAAVFDAMQLNNIDTQGTARVSAFPASVNSTTSLFLDSNSSALSSALVSTAGTGLMNLGVEDFTVEAWINVQQLPPASRQSFVASVHDNSGINTWTFFITDTLRVSIYGGNGNQLTSTNAVPQFNWAHIAAVRSGDLITVYINGQSGGSLRVSGLSYNTGLAGFSVGRRDPLASGGNFDQLFGFVSDLRVTRAARYLSNFTPPTSPLPTSGRRNNWLTFNINNNNSRENDALFDAPTNVGTNNGGILSGRQSGNYCTLSPIQKSANATLANGNLDLSTPQNSLWRNATGTIYLSSGKWYWEVECTAGSPTQTMFGIARSDWPASTVENTYPGLNGETWAYYGFSALGQYYRNGTGTSFGATTVSVGDVVGCALDLDNGNFFVSKNGVWQGTVTPNPSIGRSPLNPTRLAPGAWSPSIGVYNQSAANIGAVACNFGQRPFLYANSPTLSAGFRPISTANLPIPSVRKPNSFFEATCYTGGTNIFNTDINNGQLILALPFDSYNTYFDVSPEISNFTRQPKALYTTAGLTYTSLSGANFNGTTSYIELSSHPDFDLEQTDWTIEWYQYWNVLTGFQTVWSNNYTTAPNLLIQSQNNLGRYQLYTNGGTAILNEGNAPTAGLWYHYAVVKNGTTYTIFRNGSATGVTTYNAVTNAGSTTFRPEIGSGQKSGGGNFLNGNIRDFRIYKRWAKYTTTFDPTTATTAVVATTGTGFDKSINLGFQPDLVWVKARNIGRTSHMLVDSTRGNNNVLSANILTNIAAFEANSISLNQNGFTVGGSKQYTETTYPRTIYSVGSNAVATVYNVKLNLDPVTSTPTVSTFTPTAEQAISAINPYSPAYNHNVMMPLSGGTKWYWSGWAYYGAAGTGDNTFASYWQELSGEWDKVLTGTEYTIALSAGTQTKWYATGRNSAGQFGFGNNNNVLYFTPLSGNWSDVTISVLADDSLNSTIFALSAGTTQWYVAGNNSAVVGSGKFGNGTTTNSSWFIPVPGNWVRLKATRNSVFALSADGKWYAWGYNAPGLFGNGTTTNTLQATELSGNWSDIIPGLAYSLALSAGTQTKWYVAGSNQFPYGDPTSPNSSWYIPVSGGIWGTFKLSRNNTFALSANTTKWYVAGANTAGNAGLNSVNPITTYTPLSTTIGGDFNDLSVNYEHTFAFRPSSIGIATSDKIVNSNINTAGATYTAYGWKRNINCGFDIVNFNKLGATNETFNHNLGRIPQMMIVRGINVATSWVIYHSSMVSNNPQNVACSLNVGTSAIDVTLWNSTRPTASQFSLGTAWTAGNYLAYLFAEVPGFSSFGVYRGTGSSDGPFIWCGFKPRFLLTKRVDAVGNWLIWDSARGTYNPISPHFTIDASQDQSIVSPTYSGYLDFVSTGFKMRLASDPNSVGGNFIYAAFADDPFGRNPSQNTAV